MPEMRRASSGSDWPCSRGTGTGGKSTVWTLSRHRDATEDASYRKFDHYCCSPSLPRNHSGSSLYRLGEQQTAVSELQVTNKMTVIRRFDQYGRA